MKLLLLSLLFSNAWSSGVRDLNLKPKDVGTIRTSVGYSTVIQFNDKPINVVIGNQSAFRVEFIKNSVTIKPAMGGARTNLFVFTEHDRFNLTVVSGGSQNVDYVVRIKRTYEDPNKVTPVNRFTTVNGVRLTLTRKVRGRDGVFLDFELNNLTKQKLKLFPETIRVVSRRTPEPIRSVYIDTPSLNPAGTIRGSVYLAKDPTAAEFEFWFAFEGKQPFKFAFFNQAKAKKEPLYAF